MPKRRSIQFVYIALLVISLALGQLLPQRRSRSRPTAISNGWTSH